MENPKTPENPRNVDSTSAADPEPQTAAGKVLWHFTMSLDGFVAGPGHTTDWMAGVSFRPGLVEEYAGTTGAVLGGRDGWDAFPDAGAIYGGAWQGPLFVLTHHPEDAPPAADGRQLLERGLIDETDLHIAPVLLGDGIRLFDNPGGAPVRLEAVEAVEALDGGDRRAAVTVRYRPLPTDPSHSVR
ncbi:dihydrofolate reductase family protein [Streptomyces sp. NPDC058307]|uniref:dihydrofolate reductase family protein n=1 Tax=Streptomyces sp. NPDC058307 TaxID=3346439 RepID=UPI0036EDBF15